MSTILDNQLNKISIESVVIGGECELSDCVNFDCVNVITSRCWSRLWQGHLCSPCPTLDPDVTEWPIDDLGTAGDRPARCYRERIQ